MMKKIMLVFGTRPDAVKMSPLVNELKKRSGFAVAVTVTGQHRAMLDDVLSVFGITPDYDLSVMRTGQSLFDVMTDVLNGMKPVLEREKPDIVLVHGDTTTAFAAALACFYLHIPVGHVEAGLRTNDILTPFPEELDRRAIDLISCLDFAPTQSAADVLIKEGKSPDRVFVTGNTVVDALKATISDEYTYPELPIPDEGRLILITMHRRESIGEPMERSLHAIREVLEKHPDCHALLPMHPNPAVREIVTRVFSGCGQVLLTEPLNVRDWHNLEARCYLCLTDSGGMQEELPYLGKPVLVLRDKTERPEGVSGGAAKLVGTDADAIKESFTELLDDREAYAKMAQIRSLYGDGDACRRIADCLVPEKYK